MTQSARSLVLGLVLGAGIPLVVGAQQSYTAVRIPTLTPEQSEILSCMSIVYLDDGQGGQAKTIRITGVNVQIVNGLGATNGSASEPYSDDPDLTAVNGVGNLVLGYNEPDLSQPGAVNRTGSHNIVAGQRNNYLGYGGAVLGDDNEQRGRFSSILGGTGNMAEAALSVVVAGGGNRTLSDGLSSGKASCVVGGSGNTVSGGESVAVGGLSNLADGEFVAVVGGFQNKASAPQSSILGGSDNETTSAGGVSQCVVGGNGNVAVGGASVVGGGKNRTAASSYDWVAGSMFEDE